MPVCLLFISTVTLLILHWSVMLTFPSELYKWCIYCISCETDVWLSNVLKHKENLVHTRRLNLLHLFSLTICWMLCERRRGTNTARFKGLVPMVTTWVQTDVWKALFFSSPYKTISLFLWPSQLSANISLLMNIGVPAGSFMCQQSQQRTETLVSCSLVTRSAIISTKWIMQGQLRAGKVIQQNTLLAYYKTTTSSCFQCILEITSSWLCVGGIHCVARGCCQWSIPPPGLPSSPLWSQTAQQWETHSFINKANGNRSRCQCKLSSL